MECRNCPYGKEDFDRRMAWYNKIVEERGMPNDIYGYETYEDAANDAEQFLWCDKVGGKVYCFGRCEDAYSDIPKYENHSKKKRRNKRERDLKHKNRLKYLYKHCNFYPSPVTYTEEVGLRDMDMLRIQNHTTRDYIVVITNIIDTNITRNMRIIV